MLSLLTINWNPDPELFNFFGISIRYYGLLWIIGLAFAYLIVQHQYRDRKTMGIPPVERVMLMCYNTGDPKKLAESNAILDAQVVKYYLKGKKYPREMDVALPQFNWGAWYRAGAFQGLLRDLAPSTPGTESYLQNDIMDRVWRV